MFGVQRPRRKTRQDDAEKPFWISFSDLMTALMVLFLVTMTVSLLDVTQKISAADRKKEADLRHQRLRMAEINQILAQIKKATHSYPGITVRGNSVDFGNRVGFDYRRHTLTPEQAELLRDFVPNILDAVRTPVGDRWFKRVLVEGFTDQRGTYIYNLNLSLQRSERVLCVLLSTGSAVTHALSDPDRRMIRDHFLVGGSSFNFLKASYRESRRVELKLEFLEIGEQRPPPRQSPLDNNARCPLDRHP